MTDSNLSAPTRSPTRALLIYAAAAAGAIGVAGAVLALVYTDADGRRALATSAAIAFVTQITTYALASRAVRLPQRPILVAWAVGMLLRFTVLIAYGAALAPAWRLPLVPALLSLVVFLFLSTLLEPLLLNGDAGVAPTSRR